MENKYAKIIIDTPIKTDIHVDHNRPDMVVFDKKKGEILFVEVGITNQNILQSVELEKYRKYDILAKEYSRINKMPVKIVPYVLSWDGVVTKLYKKYRRELGIERNIHCYIQSLVLKKTFESISIDFRRYQGNKLKRDSELSLAAEKLYSDCDVVKEGEEEDKVNKP